jgi:hypothetical protein
MMGNPMFAKIAISIGDEWVKSPLIKRFEENPWNFFRAADRESGFDAASWVLTINTHDEMEANPVVVGRFQFGHLSEGDRSGRMILIEWRAYKTSPDFNSLRQLLGTIYGEENLPEFGQVAWCGEKYIDVYRGGQMSAALLSGEFVDFAEMRAGDRSKTMSGTPVFCEKSQVVAPTIA